MADDRDTKGGPGSFDAQLDATDDKLIPEGYVDITDAEDIELSTADMAFLDYLAGVAARLYLEHQAAAHRGGQVLNDPPRPSRGRSRGQARRRRG